ncbi:MULTISPECIES: HGxxPAAW family protein [unclassified Nocardiopsis]|uniref:HGxxPAAW family protein n=1 Tax=unclassified Nocardiopsis TaxID=2649073 RepID=UPI0013596812|nr:MULTISPECIES: HGxxPAAW family protein [unclassified Nocardiopsis]
MADEHHEDHGNTLSAWFLTLSWIVVWTVAATAIILGGALVTWTVVALAASAVCAVIAGVMKKAGLGRKEPRPVPPTREEWEAGRGTAAAATQAEPADAPPAEALDPDAHSATS